MKKFALILAVVMCLSVCTAAFAAPVTVRFFHRWPNEPKLSYLNGLVAEFEAENPDIKIVTDQVLNDAYKEKIRVLVSTDDIPDVFMSWSGSFATNLVRSGRVQTWDDLLAADPEFKDSIVESQWPPFQINGKQYGVPWSMDGKAFFYNKDVFAKLNLSVPTTLDELYAVCDALREAGYEEPISAGFSAPWAVSHYLGTICQRVVDPETLARDYAGQGDFTDPGYIGNAFIFGEAPMVYLQLGECKYLRDDVDFEYGFFNFPAVEGGKGDPGQLTGAPEGMMISNVAAPEVQEAAVKFVKFVISQHGGYEMTRQTGELSCVKGALDETNLDAKQLEAVQLILNSTQPALWQDNVTDAAIADAFMAGGQLLLTGDKTAEDVMKDVQAAAASIQ